MNMSNSYKKHPVYKWHGRGEKRRSSKAFRRYRKDIPMRSRQFSHRVYDSWEVWDNWYWDFDNKERYKKYRLIVKELYRNAYDNHLTEEEADELFMELQDLRDCFSYRRK